MRFSSRQRLPEPELNVTPLIDVVFLLLIFFMVSTTFDQRRIIPIQLPEADAEPLRIEQPKRMTLAIDAQGRRYLDGVAVLSDQALVESLAGAGQVGRTLLLEADGAVSHQAVVSVMALARQAGVTDLVFTTQDVAREPTP